MAGHQAQWVNACKEGYGAYTSSPLSQAGPLTETVLMGNLAIRAALTSRKSRKQIPISWQEKKTSMGWRKYENYKF